MTSPHITEKVIELDAILKEYQMELGSLEKELQQVISEYRAALEVEKIAEVKLKLSSYDKS